MAKSSTRSGAKGQEEDEPAPAQKKDTPKRRAKGAKSDETATATKKAKASPKRKKKSEVDEMETATKKAKASPKRKKKSDDDDETEGTEKKKKASPKRKKAPPPQRITDRDPLPESSWEPAAGSYKFKIATWNVAGLRALLRKMPNALSNLVQEHSIDVLCLQETKLQDQHVDDPKLKLKGHLLEDEGYDAYYSCSTAKKGYAGTAVFVKRREEAALTPQEVSYEIGKEEHDAEGRVINLDFPAFSMSNLYVPNSGQTLARLDYRTEQWDKDMLQFMQKRESDRGVPVIWLGDLNIAHTAKDVWNDGAKHLVKQAGVTPQERASFQEQLDAGYVDAFRHLHPEAQGQYTYWSQRAGNREPNKGLRLDYFICSPSLFDENENVVVRNSHILYKQEGSDHCPVVLEVEIKS